MPDSGVRVVARFISRPESIETVKQILSEMVDPTRAEEGCVTYELLQNPDDPADFTFVEAWTSLDALERHAAAEHIKNGQMRVRDHLSDASDIRVYTLIK